MAKTYSAGVVTAYGAARRGGYTGTYEQFCIDQAGFAQNAREVAQNKAEVDEALERMEVVEQDATDAKDAAAASALQAEKWARIKEGVDSDDPTYHQSAEYFSNVSRQSELNSAASAAEARAKALEAKETVETASKTIADEVKEEMRQLIIEAQGDGLLRMDENGDFYILEDVE